ncbi:hypothetical protein HBHAL_4156 [Halobacillus halophilus DSM 2266]|uniref:Uncharacterized protein n=1 Tax=Halobacillus halophilus (strain ATCC 35676 / DSM 2266 / JCM 20832 / KCTC 3685 / LMG 17431 / NBRC 102448 / NCIMB 2269) TaxID=866895 RepID=I0JQS8_HALH3|nr:hypothetical protein [Halobacillus halophilus]CCG46498.1 hypothetical protein HBHAL_4156 [Halobacillus halophilus DSM 2266]
MILEKKFFFRKEGSVPGEVVAVLFIIVLAVVADFFWFDVDQ